MLGKPWRAAAVTRVTDGDTLQLEGGDKVRIVGVNAPETAKFGKPDDPLGPEATTVLRSLVKDQPRLFFRSDRGKKDHYGRLLLHPFLPDGRNLTAELLSRGLGFHVVIPPNDWQADCYHEAEQLAIDGAKGVWGLPRYQPLAATDAKALKGGYQRVMGRVEGVTLLRKMAWVELRGLVSLKVERKHLKTVDGDVWKRLLAAQQNGSLDSLPPLVVRGWASDRRQWGRQMREQVEKGERKPFQFNIRHRYDWSLQEPTQGTKS
jgi:micrococcal nuclease